MQRVKVSPFHYYADPHACDTALLPMLPRNNFAELREFSELNISAFKPGLVYLFPFDGGTASTHPAHFPDKMDVQNFATSFCCKICKR